jgi:hypothetical protein
MAWQQYFWWENIATTVIYGRKRVIAFTDCSKAAKRENLRKNQTESAPDEHPTLS